MTELIDVPERRRLRPCSSPRTLDCNRSDGGDWLWRRCVGRRCRSHRSESDRDDSRADQSAMRHFWSSLCVLTVLLVDYKKGHDQSTAAGCVVDWIRGRPERVVKVPWRLILSLSRSLERLPYAGQWFGDPGRWWSTGRPVRSGAGEAPSRRGVSDQGCSAREPRETARRVATDTESGQLAETSNRQVVPTPWRRPRRSSPVVTPRKLPVGARPGTPTTGSSTSDNRRRDRGPRRCRHRRRPGS